jgi:hypothetical protein
MIWIVDARRDDRKRFIVRADEKLAAFLELQVAVRDAVRTGYGRGGGTLLRGG